MSILTQSLFLAGGLLSIDPKNLATVLICFIILAVVMNILIFKPLLKTIDERERLTVGSSGDVRHMLDEYDHRLAQYETTLRDARFSAYQELEKQRAATLKERMDLINSVKAEAAVEIDQAKRDLAAQVNTAETKLVREAAVVAATVASAILNRSVGGAR